MDETPASSGSGVWIIATLGYPANKVSSMVSVEILTRWLAQHGCRDQYPRRDASDPDALLYVFVKEGRRRLGIRTIRGKMKRIHFERLKQIVLQDEQDDLKNF